MYILDEYGDLKPEDDVIAWGKWFQVHGSERRVALDEWDGHFVSTVFLGLDHQFGDGPPLLWETYADGDIIERYASKAGAMMGHKRVVDLLKEKDAKNHE